VTKTAKSAEERSTKRRGAVTSGVPFDLALVDRGTAFLDGFALARIIKDDATLSKTHLVLLSSEELPEAQSETVSFGATLTKPVDEIQLRETIATAATGDATLQEKRQEPLRLGTIPGAKVLLVEDNAVNQLITTRILGKLGLAVELAHNGQEALQKQRSGQYDLVLMDCEMPVLDGYGATGKWRSYEAKMGLVRTPIVAMTAHTMPGDREACFATGMDDYIAKPVTLEALKTTLSHWLAESRRLPLGERGAEGNLRVGVVRVH
jgi:two-component system sensor histidine kinase/response regulator